MELGADERWDVVLDVEWAAVWDDGLDEVSDEVWDV